MASEITFPNAAPKELFDRDAVEFPAIVDGQNVRCVITEEALQARFGVRRVDSSEDAVRQNRPAIERLATSLIQRGRVSNGELVITSTD